MHWTSFSKDTNESDSINGKNAEKCQRCLNQNPSPPEVFCCTPVETEPEATVLEDKLVSCGPLWRSSNNFRVVRNSILKTFNCGIWIPVNLKVPGSASLLKQLVTIETSLLPQQALSWRKEQQQKKGWWQFGSYQRKSTSWLTHRSNYLSNCLCA